MTGTERKKAVVLMDLDDTILDFKKAEALALYKSLEEMGVEPEKSMLSLYSQINRRQWELLEEGIMTREIVLLSRFQILFYKLGLSLDAEEMRDRYEHNLSIGHYFIPGAVELLEALKGKYRLFIASNGTAGVQHSRLDSAGIRDYFEDIFISEEVGSQKPWFAFFDNCFSRIPDLDQDRCVIVGDSLSSDIRGGNVAGIHTIWFNPHGVSGRDDVWPERELRRLEDLPAMLEEMFPDQA